MSNDDTMQTYTHVNRLGIGGEILKKPSRGWKRIPLPGFVTLFTDGGNKFRIRYTDPVTGNDVKRRLPVFTMDDALKIAADYNREIGLKKSVPAFVDKKETHVVSVRDALIEAIRNMGGMPKVKKDYLFTANRFISWLKQQHPRTENWADIRPSFIRAWVDAGKKEVAYDTLINRLKPIRFASAYWAAEFPERYKDVVKAARIKLDKPPAKPVVALSPEQIFSYLAWLQKNAVALYPMGVICAFTGLRLMEAAYLRHCDVDLKEKTITVTETPLHKPKTRSSYRTIPVSDVVCDVIRQHLSNSAVLSIHGELFLHSKGRPWSQGGIKGAWRDAMAMARQDDKLVLPSGFLARNLRATFATIARQSGADRYLLKRYIGHVPGDVLGEHYDNVPVEEMRSHVLRPFEIRMETFWKQGESQS